MTKRLVVTRAEPDAARTADRIRARGGVALVAPMLNVEPIAGASIACDDAQALIFTSAAGVRAFAALGGASARPALCVGAATAEAARQAGFTDVQSADGDGAALAAFIAATRNPAAGPLLHICGAHLAFDLAAALAPQGFFVERRMVYRARAADALPPELIAALIATPPDLDAVLFHSARGVAAFRALTQSAAPSAFAALEAICLSPNVAAAAGESRWRAVRIAAHPNDDALLDAAFAA